MNTVVHGEVDTAQHLPFTPRANRVLFLAYEEAIKSGKDEIGTEHLLLGLVQENEGVAAKILTKLGVEKRIREILQSQSGDED